MNNYKGNPESCKRINKRRSEETYEKIKLAVRNIQSNGLEPNIKNLVEYTNLSRAAFQLKHIKELMHELQIGPYLQLKKKYKISDLDINSFLKMEKENLKIKKQLKKQKNNLDNAYDKIDKLEHENNVLRMEIYKLQLKNDLQITKVINKKDW